jgi:ubiquitin-conjugating enzyme E2 G1
MDHFPSSTLFSSTATTKKSTSGSDTLTTFAKQTLMSQLRELTRSPPENCSVGLHNDQLSTWEVMFFGPPGSLYEGGFFKALLAFPADFPNNPPSLTFVTPILHPNVYPDGRVCISILHPPGVDQFNEQESADERWRPIIGVEQILVSVLSMLTDDRPNLDSPANIDAAKLFKENEAGYKKAVKKLVRQSAENYGT